MLKKFVEMKESLVREKKKIVSCFSIFIGTLPNNTLLRNLIGRQKNAQSRALKC